MDYKELIDRINARLKGPYMPCESLPPGAAIIPGPGGQPIVVMPGTPSGQEPSQGQPPTGGPPPAGGPRER